MYIINNYDIYIHQYLILIADNYTQLHTSCVLCANEVENIVPALFSHHVFGLTNGQIDTGGSGKYIPVCRNHYIKLNIQSDNSHKTT